MASSIGHSVRLSIFGQSHSEAIGCVVEGLPAGISVDLDELQAFLARRAPGRSDTSTARREPDRPRILSGLVDGYTCGAPLSAIIENTNTRSQDYEGLRRVPRPGHADYAAYVRYGNHHDVAGGGHFSGRLTAPLCIAGGIALQALEQALGIRVVAHIAQLGPERICDERLNDMTLDPSQVEAIGANELPCISIGAARTMHEAVLAAKSKLDSVGGVIECVAYGMPAGVGDPMFDGLENRIARIAYGIPAVKGVEFGAGFGAAALLGSQNNDPYRIEDERVVCEKNDAGGILGGISTGMPIVWRAAVKPTPSIGKRQDSVDLGSTSDADLVVHGRHDPCIVPRAVPVVEAACALALLDALVDDGALPTPAPAPLSSHAI
ncbi:chorismate synthase [Parolsenella catena]|uniref:chorismate synthase n=1 Tax=Parolsenella catena TaxID=2003188 RepID=UPI0030788955